MTVSTQAGIFNFDLLMCKIIIAVITEPKTPITNQ